MQTIEEANQALLAAAAQGAALHVRAALLAGANPEARDFGRTALMLAAKLGHPDCIRMLLAAEGGVDLDALNPKGRTAAMLAAKHGNAECLGLLLEAGASLEIRDRGGLDAMGHAKHGNANARTRSLIEQHTLCRLESSELAEATKARGDHPTAAEARSRL